MSVYFVFKPSRIYLYYICTYESFLFSCCLLYTLRLPYSLNLTLPIGWSIWSEMSNPTRHRAIRLYKELYRLGRDYPDPSYNFHGRLRALFEKRRDARGEEAEKALELCEFIKKETLALYALKKYRTLRRAYPDTPSDFSGV